MSSEIRLYVEGGGDQKDTRARLRTAFGTFLGELRERARGKRIRWEVVPCGGRTSTFDDYRTALESHPDAFNVLLVDAEAPVACNSPWEHLGHRSGDGWENPGVDDEHCHLMVQTMEAWLIADPERLRGYYGPGFHEGSLPANANVEEITKDILAQALAKATRATRKGPYHKTRHAPDILATIRPEEVKRKASFCRRLFDTLDSQIDAM